MRDYGKVYSTFWSSGTTGGLSDDAKLLAAYLMTCGHGTIAGVFRLPDGYASEDLGWGPERVQQGFSELFGKGFANRCETTKWVWIVKHLEWNKLENPNQRKSAAKIAMSVPDDCRWKREFMRQWAEVLAITLPPEENPLPTVAQGLPNQYSGTVAVTVTGVQGAKAPLPPASQAADAPAEVLDLVGDVPGVPACPVKQLVGLFASKVPELPKPRYELWKDSAGAESMRQRWKWLLGPDAVREDDTRYASTAHEAVDWFARFFDTVHESDFLSGRSGQWKNCDLAWLMKRDNFMKVVQGNYENKGRVTA